MSHFLEDAAHRIIKPDADAGLWTVNFNNVEIIGKQDFGLASLELHRTEIRLHDSSSHGPYVRLETLLEGKSGVRSEDWGWLQLSKNPSTDELHVEFDTTELGAVPCWMASHWFPSLKMLGSKAQFTGHSLIKSHGRASNCFASATGEFIDIALPAIPGLPPADADAAKSLRVSDVRFENLLWSDGKAEICRDGNRYFEIPNQKYYVPDTRPNEIFTDAVRAAFRRNSNVGLRR